ncbi:glycosyltransferase family 39 protein [Pseudomonas alliivorans]|nr:glycosyltransferase family 39 protein [Pseudomonas alliivorans]MEE4698157.1 glycosyltransferase family 39 protein [Pseudomonas alliivorans]MEE4709984.1 glycosyltransferase family 39 protein [Pseudomonas alliivorans]MEE4716510.1 glycosyltransferase family 39 protein [Pseudomonas alliivorans]MEE4721949.1 glycosyltransferase family 39 protein [Pseudomonas alliivorans]
MMLRTPFTPRLEGWLLVVLAFLLIGAGLGMRQPQNVDEERFLGVALEMMQNGSWFVPHRAAEIYADKPPLFMWTVAFFIWLTGSPNIALYLPGLLSAGTITAVLYDLGNRLWEQRIGRYAALLFLATYQTYSILRTGQIDSFLCLWVALGFYGLVRHLLLGPSWRWFYFSCAAMGLGIISKGVGFVPALMLIPYAYAVRKNWHGVVKIPGQVTRWTLGLGVTLLACCLWLVPMVISVVRDGGPEGFAYVHEILLHQTASRYASAWDHREPFWYFFVKVIPQYWLPLIFALPWLIPAWRRQLSKQDGRVLVLLGWVLLVLLFFSLSSGKRKLYIFPALPGLVLVAAPLVPWLLRRWFKERAWARRIFPTVVVVWLGLWFARGFVEPLIEGENPHKDLMEQAAKVTRGADLALVNWREGHWLYARQPIVHFGFARPLAVEQAARWLREHPGAYALIPGELLANCFLPEKAHALGQTSRADWFVVDTQADNGMCRPASPQDVYRFVWKQPVL